MANFLLYASVSDGNVGQMAPRGDGKNRLKNANRSPDTPFKLMESILPTVLSIYVTNQSTF